MRILGACAIAITLVAFPSYAQSGSSGAAGSAPPIRVAFLQGEQLAEVPRPGATPLAAVRALIAGPTSAERSRGYRTYLATGTRLHRLSVKGSLVTVDLQAPGQNSPIRLQLELRDAGWRVTRVWLPSELLSGANART